MKRTVIVALLLVVSCIMWMLNKQSEQYEMRLK
jgi:hypothetical protein